MASIVKANANLTNGGLSVIRREYATSDDGMVSYEAEYVCLSQFASLHIGKFRTGANPPTDIPSSMLQLRIDGTPKMYDLTTREENGLAYFSARYTAASLDSGEVITTESSEQRNFSAAVEGQVRVKDEGSVTQTIYGTVNIAFDYISTTVRVEAKNPKVLPNPTGTVGKPFNVSVTQISGQDPILLNVYRATTVTTSSTTRSSRGTYTYARSSSGIYEPTKSLLT